MRILAPFLLAGVILGGCSDPTKDQAVVDTRFDARRADTMLAIGFMPGTGRLDAGQVGSLRAMVAEGRRAQRDEFVVVTDGSGGAIQQARAQQVSESLSNAGARWVGMSVEPSMAMGPDQVVVVRSEYRLGTRNCPVYKAGTWNPNEAASPGFGCADAYNFEQMLARPRDAAVGRTPGPADATINAEAVQRYREGRVRTVTQSTTTGGAGGGGAPTGGGASPAGS
jgi:type IV pilus biogenesis protein CpaD/CtpE